MASQADAAAGDFKERLIGNVKREVKQVMEEAVTRRGVREDSGAVTSLCAAVEACLGQGLRRRALGLFKTSSTTALLHKVAKHCEEAAVISQRVLSLEAAEPGRRSSSSGDSTSRPPLTKKGSTGSVPVPNSTGHHSPTTVRYLWIRLALFERRLARIIEHLVRHAGRYYERGALVADPDCGSILASLLVGPCALEYTRARPPDRYWPDPPAGELVQRHRISAGTTTPPPCRRPILNFRRSLNTSSEEAMAGSSATVANSSGVGTTTVANCAKDYVESLHQNSRATLLYGKNNVMVQPKDVPEPMAGYLSLHQMAQYLIIKWTPNQLMNGFAESETTDKSSFARRGSSPQLFYSIDGLEGNVMKKSNENLYLDTTYWQYALNVSLEDVVYVHCHQGEGGGGTVVLVGQDGVQRPPIHFPKGGHLLAFLSCLETGLLPHGQLDPPLWSQRGTGKVLPRGRPRRRPLPIVSEGNSNNNEDGLPANNNTDTQATDYVFRIVNNNINHQEYGKFVSRHSLLERGPMSPRVPRKPLGSASTTGSSDSSSMSMDTHNSPPLPSPLPTDIQPVTQTASIALVCTTMRRQIISRAFYGWLAYCRHLSTVRTHLSGLVNANIIPSDGTSGGLTKQRWQELTDENGVISDSVEVYRLTYYGGVDHDIRKEVWPYLLGHYQFGSTAQERSDQDLANRRRYETTMSEWLAVEAIVRQRDREATAASIARLAEPKQVEHNPEVSEDNCSFLSDDDNPPVVSPDPSEQQESSNPEKIDEEPSSFGTPSNTETRQRVTLNVESSIDDNVEMPEEGEANGQDEKMEVDEGIEETGCVREDITEQNHSDIRRIAATMARINGHVNGIVESDEVQEREDEIVVQDVHPVRHTSVIVTNPSVDIVASTSPAGTLSGNVSPSRSVLCPLEEEHNSACTSFDTLDTGVPGEQNKEGPRSNCVSPASSNGGVYSTELLENFGLNLHRIDKDVQRCDRNYWYFTGDNLDKLRNVMCTYVWEHMEAGYMQGMCDLAAPLLVLLDDEAPAYSAFCHLMDRMLDNFPAGGAMDAHFANMRSLIQILDCEMYELMHAHGDYTHFYFCYRWFLLDFKRELLYQDVFAAWEMIWAARHISSSHMVLFLALALLESYRDIILSNSMDFTDIIKFFNEMAERHNAPAVLSLARDLVLQLQTLIENK